MKRIYYFAALAAVAGVMTSCSSSDDVAGNEASQDVQSANLGITTVGIETGVTSRAATIVQGAAFESGKEIGVSLITASTVSGTNPAYSYYYKPNTESKITDPDTYGNIKWTVDNNSKWTAASPMPLYNTTAKVTAYYPYKSTTDISGFDPKAIAMNTTDGIDWMYQTCTGSTTSGKDLQTTAPAASLTMKHAQAIIAIQIKQKSSTEPYTGAGKITSITVHPAGNYVATSGAFAVAGTLNSMTGLTTGSAANLVQSYESDKEKDVKKHDVTTMSDISTMTENATDYWFVTPLLDEDNESASPANGQDGHVTKANAKVSFTIVVDGQTYKVGGESGIEVKNGETATPISRGKAYLFTLSLSDANLSVSSVSITNWTVGGTGAGDLGAVDNE